MRMWLLIIAFTVIGFLIGGVSTSGSPAGPPIGGIIGTVLGVLLSRNPTPAANSEISTPGQLPSCHEPVKARDIVDWVIRILLLIVLVIYLADRVHLEITRYQVQAELKKVRP